MNCKLWELLKISTEFLSCFRGLNGVPRFENRVPKIRENRVPRIREIGSLQVHTGCLTFSLKETE